MKKILAVMALVAALAAPVSEANAMVHHVACAPVVVAGGGAGSMVLFLGATGAGALAAYLILTGYDPWTPLFGKDGVEYSYPTGKNGQR